MHLGSCGGDVGAAIERAKKMRKMIVVLGFLATAAVPALAGAATPCEQHQADRKTTGTVIGAIAGGLLGNAVSRGGGRTGGTVIGAAGGAVVGNQLARQNDACNGDQDYDRRDAPGYGRDASSYRRDDEDRPYDSDGRNWRDSDGRSCMWRDQVDRDGDRWSHHWVQDCR
jgi:uncharacterized protein YcfJ